MSCRDHASHRDLPRPDGHRARRGHRPAALLLTTLVAAFGGAGCGPTLEFEYLESPTPSHAIVDADHIAIELGTAVGVRVTNGGTHFEPDVELMMTSEAPGVIAVEPSLEPDEFVVWGTSAGSTFVRVELDGELWESVPADVVR